MRYVWQGTTPVSMMPALRCAGSTLPVAGNAVFGDFNIVRRSARQTATCPLWPPGETLRCKFRTARYR